MNRPLPLTLAVALALGSSAAHALGLGGINVKSELNEPLRAEIPVYVSAPAEAESLRVELAAAAEFARVGLDIGNLVVPLEFEVGKNARGEPIILVKSNQAIREPTLTFLVEVNWSNGRFLREYSVLLEPPVTVPVSAPAPSAPTGTPVASVEPIAEAEPIAPTPISEPEALPDAPVAEPEPISAPPVATEPEMAEPAAIETEPTTAPSEPIASEEPMPSEPVSEAPPAIEPEVAPSGATSSSEYGPIATGETLWEIANTTRPGDVTPSQMMLALLRANPDAFYRDNVNALKRGAILRIPGSSDLQALAAAEAAAEILSQNQSWIESTRPTMVADANVESTYAAPTTTATTTRPGSRLELVPPTAGQSGSDRPGAPGGTGDSVAVRAELARTKETLTSAQQDASELRSRVKALEDLKTKNERLLTLKDSEMRSLQDKLAAAERDVAAATAAAAAAQAQASAPVAATSDPAPAVVETPVAVAPIETAPVADPLAIDPATTDPAVSDPTATDPTLAAVDPATDPTANPATDPLASTEPAIAEPAEVTPIADPEPVVVGEPVVPSEPWYASPMIKYALGGIGVLVAGLVAFMLMRRRKKDEPAVAVGTISGQFGHTIGGESEESSMLEALASDPTDLNAHLNVLEFYYMRRNADKFEAAAEAMYAQLPDPNAPEWQGALLMGRDLCPTHPMFGDESGTPAAGSTSFADPFAAMPNFEGHAPKSQPAGAAVHDDFDFDLGVAPPAAVSSNVPITEPSAQSFDFNLIDDNAKRAAPAKAKDELSFDFDLDQIDTSSTGVQKASDISFELPALDLGAGKGPEPVTQQMNAMKDDFMGDDAVATKIDLARAYLDMGDADGARSMLEEVLGEGSDSQKAEASKLLAEIK